MTNCKKKSNSHFSRLQDCWSEVNSEIGFVVVTWEDLVEKIIADMRVKQFLLGRLKQKN